MLTQEIMRFLLELFRNNLRNHFEGKSQYLSLFCQLNIAPEEWFRGEILYALSSLQDITILATNQAINGFAGKPDFVIQHKTQQLALELKVLPKDRNYQYGWQRFLANYKNKLDFERLQDRKRHGVIYVYWPNVNDWKNCKNKLLEKYSVTCVYEFEIPTTSGTAIFSLWLQTEQVIGNGDIT